LTLVSVRVEMVDAAEGPNDVPVVQFSNSVDFLIHVRPEQFTTDLLATLRRVSPEFKQQICDVVIGLHAAARVKILESAAAFATVQRVRIVDLDFSEWAAHCAERFAGRAVSHVEWFRCQPDYVKRDANRYEVGIRNQLISQLVGSEKWTAAMASADDGSEPPWRFDPAEKIGDEEKAALTAMDLHRLICSNGMATTRSCQTVDVASSTHPWTASSAGGQPRGERSTEVRRSYFCAGSRAVLASAHTQKP